MPPVYQAAEIDARSLLTCRCGSYSNQKPRIIIFPMQVIYHLTLITGHISTLAQTAVSGCFLCKFRHFVLIFLPGFLLNFDGKSPLQKSRPNLAIPGTCHDKSCRAVIKPLTALLAEMHAGSPVFGQSFCLAGLRACMHECWYAGMQAGIHSVTHKVMYAPLPAL